MKRKKFVKNVTALMCALSLFNLMSCGTSTTNSSGNGNSDTGQVDNFKQYVKNVTIKSYPTKSDYVEGEKIDLSGLVFDAEWSVYGENILIENMTYQDLEFYTKKATSGLKEITCIIGEYTFTLPITVTNSLDIYSALVIERIDGSQSKEVVVNTTFIKAFRIVAKGKDATSDKVLTDDDYTINVKVNGVTDESLNVNNLFSKIGEIEFKIEFASLSISDKYVVIDGYTIYASKLIETKDIKEDTKNFLEKRFVVDSDDPTQYIKVSHDAGVNYCGEIRKGANLYFHIWSDYEKTADTVLYASSTERTCTELGDWEPTETGDQKFNSIFDVSYENKEIVIDDNVILPGCESKITTGSGPFDSKGRAYDTSIWVNWQAVNFGSIKLKKGDNIIKLTNKKGNVCNVYALEVKFKGE